MTRRDYDRRYYAMEPRQAPSSAARQQVWLPCGLARILAGVQAGIGMTGPAPLDPALLRRSACRDRPGPKSRLCRPNRHSKRRASDPVRPV